MIHAIFAGFLSAWMLTASPVLPPAEAVVSCNISQTGASASATAAQGGNDDEVNLGLTLGTSGSPAKYMHEYEIVVVLGQALAQGATVSVDFSGGWVQGSNNYGSASLNAQRTEITVHYTLPSCAWQTGYGFVADVAVDNNGQKLNANGLVSSSGGTLIVVIDP
jgi:hypothetical protein